MTKHEITYLHAELEYPELTKLFNWDLDHWHEMLQDMTDGQYKRFIALKLNFSGANPKEVQDKALKDLIDFLDQFGINRIK